FHGPASPQGGKPAGGGRLPSTLTDRTPISKRKAQRLLDQGEADVEGGSGQNFSDELCGELRSSPIAFLPVSFRVPECIVSLFEKACYRIALPPWTPNLPGRPVNLGCRCLIPIRLDSIRQSGYFPAMRLVAPDLLAELCGLSQGLIGL